MTAQTLVLHEQRAVIDPASGEVIQLAEATTTRLAALIDDSRDLESRVREMKRAVTGELCRRLDDEATLSVRLGGWKVTAQNPEVTAYDGPALFDALHALVDQDIITLAAAEKAVEITTDYLVHANGVKALWNTAKPPVRSAIAECRTVTANPQRRVTVTREDTTT